MRAGLQLAVPVRIIANSSIGRRNPCRVSASRIRNTAPPGRCQPAARQTRTPLRDLRLHPAAAMMAKATKPGSIPSGTISTGISPPSPARPGGARQSRSPDHVTGAARICSKAGRAASFSKWAPTQRAQARHPDTAPGHGTLAAPARCRPVRI